MAHGREGNGDGVVQGERVAATESTAEADGDEDELQDGGHSKRRRLRGGDDERPTLPPPIPPGESVPRVDGEHATG